MPTKFHVTQSVYQNLGWSLTSFARCRIDSSVRGEDTFLEEAPLSFLRPRSKPSLHLTDSRCSPFTAPTRTLSMALQSFIWRRRPTPYKAALHWRSSCYELVPESCTSKSASFRAPRNSSPSTPLPANLYPYLRAASARK
jgi:hypothetical protein